MYKNTIAFHRYYTIFKSTFNKKIFLRNSSTSTECRDVLKSLKKSGNWFLETSICIVYDTTFKIDQTLFIKISKFRNFQNSFSYGYTLIDFEAFGFK